MFLTHTLNLSPSLTLRLATGCSPKCKSTTILLALLLFHAHATCPNHLSLQAFTILTMLSGVYKPHILTSNIYASFLTKFFSGSKHIVSKLVMNSDFQCYGKQGRQQNIVKWITRATSRISCYLTYSETSLIPIFEIFLRQATSNF
jgi:hypothetical protein